MPDSEPIASAEQYQTALLAIRQQGLQWSDIPVLKAFCAAPGCKLTAAELALACHFSTSYESHIRFGMLAERIGKALAYKPAPRKDGTIPWWRCAATSGDGHSERSESFPWTLRLELVEALRRMKWVGAG